MSAWLAKVDESDTLALVFPATGTFFDGSSLRTMIGTSFSHYQITAKLGEGGMGEVYRATDLRLGREVAIKILPRDLAEDPLFRRRFNREARTISRLQHPNICSLFDIGSVDDRNYLVMELLDGQTLAERLRDPDQTTSAEEALQIGVQVARGVTEAHESGVIHRDLKPENVVLTKFGAKVVDFGLARDVAKPEPPMEDSAETRDALTQEGAILGTLPYMAPEQLRGRASGRRTDVWALGCLIYETATGNRPFRGDTSADLITAILSEDPPSMSRASRGPVAGLDEIVQRCLKKRPAQRFRSAAELLNELEALSRRRQGVSDTSTSFGPDPLAKGTDQGVRGLVRRAPLIARDEEWDRLTRRFEATQQGRGGLVSLSGEPGIGKSRLSRELVGSARAAGFLALEGHCREMDGAPPYGPWVEILERITRALPKDELSDLLAEDAPELATLLPELRRLLPDVARPLELPPEQRRRYLFRCFREFLERLSKQQALLLVLEDLHWADEATLLFLQDLAHQLEEMPVLVLGTYRDAPSEHTPQLTATLSHLGSARLLERVPLRRLTISEVGGLLRGLSGQELPVEVARGIHEVTAGNPFFVEEIFLYLAEQGPLSPADGSWSGDLLASVSTLPEGVNLAVAHRLERLSEETRRILTTAAVLGRRFRYRHLEVAHEGSQDQVLVAIEEAEKAAILEPLARAKFDQDDYQFSHDLVRKAVLADLSLPRRRRLHLRAAQAIEKASPDPDNACLALAYHLFHAGSSADRTKTLHYLTLAGQRAADGGAWEEALSLADRALSLITSQDTKTRAAVLFQRGLALRSLGRWEQSTLDWMETLRLFEELGESRAAIRVVLGLANYLQWSNRPRETADLAARGRALAKGESFDALRCTLLALAGVAHSRLGEFERSAREFDKSKALAEKSKSPRLMGNYLAGYGPAMFLSMRYPQAIDAMTESIRLLATTDDAWVETNTAGILPLAKLYLGRTGEVWKELPSIRRNAEHAGHIGTQFFASRLYAFQALFKEGDFEGVEEHAEKEISLSQAAGNVGLEARALEAFSQFWQGRWSEASRRFGDVVALEGDDFSTRCASAGHFLCLAYAGKTHEALRLLSKQERFLPISGRPNRQGSWTLLFAVVEGLALLGESRRAASYYPLVAEALESEAVVRWLGDGLIETVAGIAAACAGQWSRSESHYERALRQARELPHLIAGADSRRWYAQMLIERGHGDDHQKANRLLEEAIESYEHLGMPKHLELATILQRRARLGSEDQD